MERLTFEGNFCDIAVCLETPGGSFCEEGPCTQRKVWERLKLYEDAEAEGRLVIFPCALRDILYYFPAWYAKSGYMPEPMSVNKIESHNGIVTVECYLDPDTELTFFPADFGESVFLTREAALAAMKEG